MTIRYPNPVSWEDDFNRWVQLAAELGADGLDAKLDEIRVLLDHAASDIRALAPDPALTAAEPNDLDTIRALRPEGRRRIWETLPVDEYRDRMLGAFLGRSAGCTLGAPVELFAVEKMANWAAYIGDDFPPTDYWSQVERPNDLGYHVSPRFTFTPSGMDGVPTDDDIIFTQLGLLILEDHGPDFTVDDVGAAWRKYVPYAHTAEKVALENLHAGVAATEAADQHNPYIQYIGADIRSDPWGYAAPGLPEKAAELAYRDAYLSHRRNGIYGAMYFSAVIAAAFTVEDPVDALVIGLEEIPRDCLFAQGIRWSLEIADQIKDYRDANAAIAEAYGGMHRVHAINNGCLVVWGLTIGGRDFTKIIGETIAMSYDNDCTGATVGSIAGAVLGKDGIPEHWWKNFNNTAHTYLIGQKSFPIDDLVDRFTTQAQRVFDVT